MVIEEQCHQALAALLIHRVETREERAVEAGLSADVVALARGASFSCDA